MFPLVTILTHSATIDYGDHSKGNSQYLYACNMNGIKQTNSIQFTIQN